MKYIILTAVAWTLATACSTPPDRSAIALQEHYLINQTFRNQARSAKIIRDAGQTSRPSEIAAVENIKRISTLRDSYTVDPIATNLLAYTDSIQKLYQSSYKPSTEIISAIERYRQNILRDDQDSSSIRNLFGHVSHCRG